MPRLLRRIKGAGPEALPELEEGAYTVALEIARRVGVAIITAPDGRQVRCLSGGVDRLRSEEQHTLITQDDLALIVAFRESQLDRDGVPVSYRQERRFYYSSLVGSRNIARQFAPPELLAQHPNNGAEEADHA